MHAQECKRRRILATEETERNSMTIDSTDSYQIHDHPRVVRAHKDSERTVSTTVKLTTYSSVINELGKCESN